MSVNARPIRPDIAVREQALRLIFVRGLQAIGGEAVQGIVHYALSLTLIARLVPGQYAIFASVIASAGVCISYLNAIAGTSAQVHLGRMPKDQASKLCSTLFSVSAGYSVAVFVGLFSLFLCWRQPPDLAAAAALVVCLWPFRTFVKSVGYAHGRAVIAVSTDGIYGLVMIAAVVMAGSAGAGALRNVLVVMSGANAVAIAAGLWALRRNVDLRRLLWFEWSSYKGLVREVGWTSLGNTATTVQAYAYTLIFAVGAGSANVKFAALSAALAIFGPVRLVVGAWQNAVRADLARFTDEDGRSFLGLSTAAVAAAAVCTGVAIAASWPFLRTHLFAKYATFDMRSLTFGWYAVSIVYALRSPAGVLLQAQRRFKRITISIIVGATVNFAITLVLALRNAPLALYPLATLAGELCCAVDQWRAGTSSRATPRRFPPNPRQV